MYLQFQVFVILFGSYALCSEQNLAKLPEKDQANIRECAAEVGKSIDELSEHCIYPREYIDFCAASAYCLARKYDVVKPDGSYDFEGIAKYSFEICKVLGVNTNVEELKNIAMECYETLKNVGDDTERIGRMIICGSKKLMYDSEDK